MEAARSASKFFVSKMPSFRIGSSIVVAYRADLTLWHVRVVLLWIVGSRHLLLSPDRELLDVDLAMNSPTSPIIGIRILRNDGTARGVALEQIFTYEMTDIRTLTDVELADLD